MPSTMSSSLSKALAVFNGDHAFFADFVHGLSDDLANAVCQLLAEMEPTWAISLEVVVGLGGFLQLGNQASHSFVDTAL